MATEVTEEVLPTPAFEGTPWPLQGKNWTKCGRQLLWMSSISAVSLDCYRELFFFLLNLPRRELVLSSPIIPILGL